MVSCPGNTSNNEVEASRQWHRPRPSIIKEISSRTLVQGQLVIFIKRMIDSSILFYFILKRFKVLFLYIKEIQSKEACQRVHDFTVIASNSLSGFKFLFPIGEFMVWATQGCILFLFFQIKPWLMSIERVQLRWDKGRARKHVLEGWHRFQGTLLYCSCQFFNSPRDRFLSQSKPLEIPIT